MGKAQTKISTQYIGSTCHAVVKEGDKVLKGMRIAVSNDEKSGIYSTVSGKVVRVTQNAITIETEVAEKKPEPPKKEIKKIKNVAALDGLRTFAIVSVMLYHLGFQWFKGGLIGVALFFVLSGYLITGLIKSEIEGTGKLNLKRFWLHRVRRLFPAIFLVVVVVAIACLLFSHLLLTKMRPDIIPSLVWMQNWWYIFRGLSYFDSIGDPSPLVHFWSLAIEEQFYLIWPLLLMGAYKLGAKNKVIRRICLGLGVASAVAMAIMYDPHADPTRVYYGTDTRAFSLLFGAWLAYVWPFQRFGDPDNHLDREAVNKIDAVGCVVLLALLVIMIIVDGTSPLMFYGVIALSSVLGVVLIGILCVPNSRIAKVFAWKPLVWIGKRSYGMYLWHFPIMLLLKPLSEDGRTDIWWFALIVFAVTIGVSALSYQFIENPIRQGKLKKFSFKKNTVLVGSCCLLLVATVIGVIAAPDETYVPEGAIQSTGEDADHAMIVQGKAYPLLVGDSVPGEIKFQTFFPHGVSDAVVGRNPYQASQVVQEYMQKGTIDNCVIVDCFSNNAIGNGDLDRMLNAIGDSRHLFLVNSYMPNAVCESNNKVLLDFVHAHPSNVHLIDWYGEAAQNPDKYLYKDKIHPNLEGQAVLLKITAETVNEYLPDEAKCDVSKIEAKLKQS